MKATTFVILFLILAILCGFFVFRFTYFGLQTTFDVSLTILKQGNTPEGVTSVVKNEVNSSIVRWPNRGIDSYDISLSRKLAENMIRINPVKFEFFVELNGTGKTIIIQDFKKAL